MTLNRVIPAFVVGLALAAGLSTPLLAQHVSGTELGREEQQAGQEAKQLVDQAEGHAPKEGHAEVNTDPLEFKKDLALWTGVVFLLLLLVLWWFAWGPIIRALDQREQAVANQIAAAEKSNLDAKAVLVQYEKKLADAKDEVRGILDQARRDAEQTGRQIVEAARGEVKVEHQRALAEIENATAGALQELAERSADLAVGLAGKIVRSELKAADHATLVERAVADFARKKTVNM